MDHLSFKQLFAGKLTYILAEKKKQCIFKIAV